jgi:hypothetical protein
VNSGSGCPALPHHGASDAQREIKRPGGVENQMNAAFAQYAEVQGNAGTLAVDREQRVQRVTAEDCAWVGAGLPAGWLALSLAVAISPIPLGGLVGLGRPNARAGRSFSYQLPRFIAGRKPQKRSGRRARLPTCFLPQAPAA